jgi:hypothetical protein
VRILGEGPCGSADKTEMRVLGFANAYRAPFAVFRALGLAPVWLAAQPSTQMTLSLATAAHLELVNAARDARALQVSFSVDPARTLAHLQQGLPTTEVEQQQGVAGVRVDEVVPITLLARLAFFVGRHQATFVSLQWKATFVLTPTLSYLLSSLSMTLNTFGPHGGHCARRATPWDLERRAAHSSARLFLPGRAKTTSNARTRGTGAPTVDEPSACRGACGSVGCSRDIAGVHPLAQLSSSATMSRCLLGYGISVSQIVSRITRMFVLPEQSVGSSSRTAAKGQQ